jgi:hypothetical protein
MIRKSPSSFQKPSFLQHANADHSLQDAKATVCDLVHSASIERPQHVKASSREALVVVETDELRQIVGVGTGQLLADALQASPHRMTKIEPRRAAMPVRPVKPLS